MDRCEEDRRGIRIPPLPDPHGGRTIAALRSSPSWAGGWTPRPGRSGRSCRAWPANSLGRSGRALIGRLRVSGRRSRRLRPAPPPPSRSRGASANAGLQPSIQYEEADAPRRRQDRVHARRSGHRRLRRRAPGHVAGRRRTARPPCPLAGSTDAIRCASQGKAALADRPAAVTGPAEPATESGFVGPSPPPTPPAPNRPVTDAGRRPTETDPRRPQTHRVVQRPGSPRRPPRTPRSARAACAARSSASCRTGSVNSSTLRLD